MTEDFFSTSSDHDPNINVPAPIPLQDQRAPDNSARAVAADPAVIPAKTSDKLSNHSKTPRPTRQRYARRVLLIRFVVWIAFAGSALLALDAGIVLRRNFWAATTGQLRFPADIQNAWTRGSDVLNQARRVHEADKDTSPTITWKQFFRGYLATYDAAINAHSDGDYQNDYPPIRLLAAALWVRSARLTDPKTDHWTESATEPLLNFNTGAEILGALAAFLLVFRIVHQQRRPPARSFWTRSLLARPPPDPVLPSMNELWRQPTGVLGAVLALLSIGYYAFAAYRLGYWPDWIDQTNLPGATDLLTLLVIFIALLASIQSMTVPYMAWFAGFLAALLVWFNPAMLMDAHAWPQWDCWIVPAYLLAALFVSLDWGFAAGATIAIGCCIKGQLLVGAPILILWPLLAGRFRTAVMTVIGFVVVITFIASPWLVPTDSWKWVIGFAAVAAIVPFVSLFVRKRTAPRDRAMTTTQRLLHYVRRDPRPLISLAFAAVISGMLLYHWHSTPPEGGSTISQQWALLSAPKWWSLVTDIPDWISLVLFKAWFRILIAIVIAAVPWFLRRRWSRFIAIAAFLAVAVWLGFYRSPGGSNAWYTVGFKYGGDRYSTIIFGDTFNLPALLSREHQLQPDSQIDLDLPWTTQSTSFFLRNIEFGAYALSLVIIAIGAALNERRRDTRLLLALAAPWVVMFAVLPQMHERYLMYAAVISSVCVATGTGDTLACLLLTALAAIQIMLASINAGASTMLITLRAYLSAADPGLGWLTVVCAGLFLVNSVCPRLRPWSPQPNDETDLLPDPAPTGPAATFHPITQAPPVGSPSMAADSLASTA